MTGSVEHLRDVLVRGVALVRVTHPDDMARLLFAFAGATMAVDAAVRLRLRSNGEWRPVDIDVSHVRDRSWRLALAPVHSSETASRGSGDRVAALESRLRRIAIELQGTGVLTESALAVGDAQRMAGVNQLSGRQREIVLRLAHGERVGGIAAEMYLSASTVRNHLSAAFRKFGVHSQQELLFQLHGQEDENSEPDVTS